MHKTTSLTSYTHWNRILEKKYLGAIPIVVFVKGLQEPEVIFVHVIIRKAHCNHPWSDICTKINK